MPEHRIIRGPGRRLGGRRSSRISWNDRPVKSGDPRDRRRVAEERLGRHHDQRLAEVALHLPAQEVEILRRGRHVRDLDVVLGAGLQEALEPRGRVLRALALVAVGEQQHDAAGALPLRLAADDELVDDHLRAVGEVAELRLPEAEHVGIVERVAVVEAEDRGLGKQRVVDAELAPASRRGA